MPFVVSATRENQYAKGLFPKQKELSPSLVKTSYKNYMYFLLHRSVTRLIFAELRVANTIDAYQ